MLRTVISLVVVWVLTPVISFFTAYVVIGHDSSQVDTIGDIRLQGFPIWFQESAPGYSVADGWHPERFWLNTALWAIVLTALVLIGFRLLRGRGVSQRIL
jgi:hypothetical protein